MYYQNYENYMKSVLGYPVDMEDTYYKQNYGRYNETKLDYNDIQRNTVQRETYLELYPEIYKIVNPMICKVCGNNTEPITKEIIEKMTDEVYRNLEEVEIGTVVNVKATVNNGKISSSDNKITSKINKTTSNVTQKGIAENSDNSKAKIANSMLKDLIKILILKKLFEENKSLNNFPIMQHVNPGISRAPILQKEYFNHYTF